MAQSDEQGYDIESPKIEASELAGGLRSSFQQNASSFRSNTIVSTGLDEGNALQWAAIERMPTNDRVRSSLFDVKEGSTEDIPKRKQVIDATKIDASERQLFIERLIKHVEHDNLHFLQQIRKRMDKVGIQFPTVEVRYSDLHIEAQCEVVHGKLLQTLWSSFKRLALNLSGLSILLSQIYKMNIIDGVSGVIKPGRMTLLLGPPGCGKTSLLKALTGNLGKSLKVTGEIAYNGYKLNEVVPQNHSAYISQHDVHIPEMTVRETLDCSFRFQGVGSRTEMIKELIRREKEAGIFPDPDIDTYMKAISVAGQPKTLQTDYILKILGLDICADTLVGDAMKRGISGGQKKRLTTGEMISGPARALFMDEISNGLDSSTTYQIVVCLQHLAHVTDATILIALLQPPPETFALFDDIILLAEGEIVYHGSRDEVLEFFESCGFRCPERKGTAEFLQEVLSETDQAQYWYGTKETYTFHSVSTLSRKFKASTYAHKLTEELSLPLLKSKSSKDAINYSVYILNQWSIFRACISREFLLMKRNSFIYIFKAVQVLIIAVMTMTVFLRTRMEKTDLTHANYYMGALFYALISMHVDGFPELSMTLSRLDIFYKQKDFYFYPAWAYAIPSVILKVPLSVLPAIVWTSLTYFVIGYSPNIVRFLRHFLLLFCVHLWSVSHFRFLAAVTRSKIRSLAAADFFLVVFLIFNGFIIPRESMPIWLRWGFWISPFSYAEIGLTVNEFLSPRWQKMLPTKTTVGQLALEGHGLNFEGHFFWIAIGALFGFIVLLNAGFVLALIFLPSPSDRAIISSEKVSEIKRIRKEDGDVKNGGDHKPSRTVATESQKVRYFIGRVTLPFEPLSIVFQDLHYYIDKPLETREHGSTEKRLELLRGITGNFRPGVLTAVMGVSGAGKTTLFDVLAGRKTSGTVEGEIKVGGYPKVQKTFARISGYCEQNDIHSPQITIEESVVFSAWLGLDPVIDSKTKSNFVKEVLATIELDGSKDALVGSLSSEQRKRLTIAVELVANPSILFLDEPTTGLDLRSTTIVMRAVKNVAETGRTVVCTIHQPSINIFESFDEVFLLKSGGRMIYSGPLGPNSCKMIEYFEGITGVPKLEKNYNPATWMLDVSSTSSEAALGVDFAEIYLHSALHQNNKELAKTLSSPQPGSKDLHFPTEFPQNGWCQFKACLWKHYWSYWRSPSYNLFRLLFVLGSSLLYGGLFWQQGKKLENQQNLFSVLGSMFSVVFIYGVVNCSTVMPYVSTERSVLYRERFSGMYASRAYALAQVVIEIPYILVQVIIFTVITYPMIGYYSSGYKVFWYMYSTFCSLLYFNYAGMMILSITSSFSLAMVIQSAFFAVINLFSGFIVPRPQIPKWWIWLYYLTPSSWTLNSLLTSQYGDIDKEIEVFGVTKTVSDFLRDYYGFHRDMLPIVGIVLLLYPLLFASVFALSIQYLNFQKR